MLYRDGVEIGDQRYVDGGLAAPIPVREAYQQGARRIIVIRTMPKDSEVESPWAHKLKSWICSSQRCPAVIDLITQHESAYKKALEFMRKPPRGVEIIQVYPETELGSKLVNSEFKDLDEDYNKGVKAGLHFLQEYGATFEA